MKFLLISFNSIPIKHCFVWYFFSFIAVFWKLFHTVA